MDDDEQVSQRLDKFSAAINNIDDAIHPLLDNLQTLRSSSPEDIEKLDGLSRARLHITMAYTVNSLFCMYLRTQGIDPTTHPVSSELGRVQDAFLRLRKVEAGQSAKHVPPPKRDVRENITKIKLAEQHLAALIFPEETQLVRALNGDLTKKKTLDEESDDDDEAGENNKKLSKKSSNIVEGDGLDADADEDEDEVETTDKKKKKSKDKEKKKKKKKKDKSEISTSTPDKPKKRKAEDDVDDLVEEGKQQPSGEDSGKKQKKKKKKRKKE